MTRYLTALLLTTMLSYTTNAQSDFKFSGGFFLGVTGTQVDGDKFAGFNKGGFTVGATAQYPISPKFLAAIEMNFTQKGAQSKSLVGVGGGASFPNIYNLRVQYVEIPLLVKFYDRKTFGLGIGIEYSRLIGNAKQYIDPFGYLHVRGVDAGFEDYDISGLAEASYYFTPKLQLNLRYAYGWTPMGHSSESDYKDFECYNNVIMVRLGYIFNQSFDERKKKPKPEDVP